MFHMFIKSAVMDLKESEVCVLYILSSFLLSKCVLWFFSLSSPPALSGICGNT